MQFEVSSPDWEANDATCEDAGSLPQQSMNACAAWEYGQADGELNRIWRPAMDAMRLRDQNYGRYGGGDDRPSYADTLREAQRAWISFRDAHCRSEAYVVRGGSLEPLLYNGCRARMTRERTTELRMLTAER